MMSVATDTPPGVPQTEVLRRVTVLAESVREAELEVRRRIDERDAAIREAIDLYLVSHRQVARAAGLSLGRIHGILAND
jgi:hypothetical protein